MFFCSDNDKDLFNNFEKIGLKNDIKNNNVLIKIKSAKTYRKNHPCTDIYLLKKLVTFIYQNEGSCAITEGSDGYLTENLITSGLKDILNGIPRPRLHINLQSSVVNVFLVINNYSPFKYYLNGGVSYNEKTGDFTLPETYIGNNALELDNYLFQTYFNDCEYPEYLNILKTKTIT